MRKRLEIALHIILITLAVSFTVTPIRAQYCADNLNPCQGEPCNTYIETCENNPCSSGDCTGNSFCCQVRWGLCPDAQGCQRKRCCDGQNNQFCEDGFCRWLP